MFHFADCYFTKLVIAIDIISLTKSPLNTIRSFEIPQIPKFCHHKIPWMPIKLHKTIIQSPKKSYIYIYIHKSPLKENTMHPSSLLGSTRRKKTASPGHRQCTKPSGWSISTLMQRCRPGLDKGESLEILVTTNLQLVSLENGICYGY